MENLVPTLLGAALAISGFTVSSVSIVFWLSAPLSIYGRLLFIIGGIAIVAFLMLGATAWSFRDARVFLPHHNRSGRRLFFCTLCSSGSPEDEGDDGCALNITAVGGSRTFTFRWSELSQVEVMVLLALNNGVLSIMSFYASPPTRTPPLIASLLASLSVVAAIPLSKFSLGDRKIYMAFQPILAVSLILSSTVISLLPTMLSHDTLNSSESAGNVFGWTCIMGAAQIPAAMANVAVQAYLMRAGAHMGGLPGRRASIVGIFRFVFYNQLFVALTVAAFFWVDMLPWFGSSASFEQFFEGLRFSFSCSLLGPEGSGPPPSGTAPGSACESSTPLYALLAITTYGAYLVGFALVARDGGVFGTIVQVLTSVSVSVVWLIPGVDPDSAATPLWAVLPALAFAVAGTITFKIWELSASAAIAAPGISVTSALGLEPVADAMHAQPTFKSASGPAELSQRDGDRPCAVLAGPVSEAAGRSSTSATRISSAGRSGDGGESAYGIQVGRLLSAPLLERHRGDNQ